MSQRVSKSPRTERVNAPGRIVQRSRVVGDLSRAKKRVEAATVRLPTVDGQGFLIPGGFVLTAAHCVASYNSGGMTLGDHCIEVVEPKTGPSFRLSIYAVDPVADLAVLGEPDTQVFYEDATVFEAFRGETEPVPMRADDPGAQGVPVRLYLLTHKGEWVTATIQPRTGELLLPFTWITYDGNIEGGTSGGPIIDEAGLLVGVVSNGDGDGRMPQPYLALPRWIWQRIERGDQ